MDGHLGNFHASMSMNSQCYVFPGSSKENGLCLADVCVLGILFIKERRIALREWKRIEFLNTVRKMRDKENRKRARETD